MAKPKTPRIPRYQADGDGSVLIGGVDDGLGGRLSIRLRPHERSYVVELSTHTGRKLFVLPIGDAQYLAYGLQNAIVEATARESK
jgi:hypothetical protein